MDKCPKCSSENISKTGVYTGVATGFIPRATRHSYQCKNCGNVFVPSAYPLEDLVGLSHQTDEGIQYLLDRPELKEKLDHYGQLNVLQKSIKEFISTRNLGVLDGPIRFYQSTNIAKPEGSGYEDTIWNSQVSIRGKAEYLEDIFDEIIDIWRAEKSK